MLPRWYQRLLKRFRRDLRRHARLVASMPSAPTWSVVEVPVIDGRATLPDGRVVESSSQIVSVAVLDV